MTERQPSPRYQTPADLAAALARAQRAAHAEVIATRRASARVEALVERLCARPAR